MATLQFFPTLIHRATLQRPSRTATLRERLLQECLQLRADDGAGRRWSKRNYPRGYTSYGSVSQMQRVSPTFAQLEGLIDREVARFARKLDFDLQGRTLTMTDCWVNIMKRGAVHGLHLHPLSAVSGTYYVQTPAGAPGLKFEDPRLDRFMASPPRRERGAARPWVVLPAKPGEVLLFESWLRHEVMSQGAPGERISISFNYNWF